jgi:hypothetical protein
VRFRDRSATDLAVLGILFIVGFVLIISAIGVLMLELFQPDVDTAPIIEVESEILAILVGALVGFVGGRQAGRNEADAAKSDTPP